MRLFRQPMKRQNLKETLDAIGLYWVTLILLAAMSSLIYLGPALWQTWSHRGPTLVTEGSGSGDGFVAGHDFVAFYSASSLVQEGRAALVYNEAEMVRTQHRLVGSADVGYLAFMYPPTILLVLAPLSTLPYFAALALWLLLPFCAYLFIMYRQVRLPPAAMFMVVTAPSVAQTLFAGQNGLLLAVLLTAGLLNHRTHPTLGGILLGLATVKPQLAILIFPALFAGRHWRVLIGATATLALMAALTTALFGADVWQAYAGIPAMAREWLAQGRLPWARMPTVYTAMRLAGAGDMLAGAVQIFVAVGVFGGVAWIWWRRCDPALSVAALLAAVPLTTPFLYDYDLPFMLTALALFTATAVSSGWRKWEKPLLLLVWLQPVWWWTLSATVFQLSIAPILYGLFFLATLSRIHWSAARQGQLTPGQ